MSNSADTRRIFSYIFIGALALLFAFEWGPGSRGCDSRLEDQDVAATVNGSAIPLREFARNYTQQAEQFRRQGVPSEMLKQFGIHKQVLDQLVNTELLAQAAEKKGLAAGNEDLVKLLKEAPAFQKDGRFDRDTYQQYVRDFEGTTEVLFEDKLRRQLSAQRMIQLVESSVVVSDDEVKARYLKDGNAAKATFVRFTPAMYLDKVGTPKPAELEAWVKANDAAIKDYYEKNKFQYFQPEKVKAKQILLRVAPDATAEKKAEAKARIENVRKEIVDNKKDFAEMAKQFSEDVETKEKGGDLGYVERLQLPGNFADLLFALKPGEVSAPVETPMGWFLGTVDDKKAPEQKPIESVKAEIASQLFVKEKAKALAKADAEKALAEVKKGKTLAELFPPAPKKEGESPFAFGQETKPEAKETGEFNSAADAIPQLGALPAVQKQIFDRKEPGLIDQLVEAGDALAVIVVDERKVATDEAFAAQKTQLQLEAVKGKQFEVREAFLKSLKQSGTVVTNDPAINKVIGAES